MRWLPFFLPTLAGAFATTTSRLTTILGFGEMAGLSTLFIGRQLDAGEERRFMLRALALVGVSSALALVGNLWLFGISYVLLIVGASAYTVSGHTYFSRRIPFERRARTIGLFETSWAAALLVGAPLVALLITSLGWRAPFLAVLILAAGASLLVAGGPEDAPPMLDAGSTGARERLNTDAWIVIGAAAGISVAGLTTIVIAGTWLDDALGVSTGGVGLVAMAFGAAELTASMSSAAVADRIGPIPSTQAALLTVLVGLGIMTQAGSSLAIGALGLLFFFLGFEYSIVTSFSVVSEAMPSARGRVLAVNNAVSTVTRGSGVVLSGVLYESYGINGPVAVSAAAAVAAIALLTVRRRRATSGAAAVRIPSG